jgi:hypothetical protein
MPEDPLCQYLYPGPDLETAYEKSAAIFGVAGSATAGSSGWVAASWAARSALRHAGRKLSSLTATGCQEVIGFGYPSGQGHHVRVRYVGEMKNFRFLVNSCFTRFEIAEQRALSPLEAVAAVRRSNEDMLMIDADSPLMSPRVPALRLPPWLKQRVSLPLDWSEFITSLPRGTRREVARFLRKYRYQSRVTNSDSAFQRFHRHLYRPHVSRRFGEEAVVLDEPTFRHESAGTQLVELLHDGEVVAGNVVRLAGDIMWILWCGFSGAVEARGLKGVTDALDYFSLLYGACHRVRQVDFGRSRPRLNDGPLMYKAKWNPQVHMGVLRKSPLIIAPRSLDAPVAAALARNQWVVRRGARLTGTVLFDRGPASEEELQAAYARYRQPGIQRIRLCAMSGFQENVDAVEWSRHDVDLVDLASTGDPLRRYLE